MRDVDPLACDLGAAFEWAERHRVPWALVWTLRRASSQTRTLRWDEPRRAFRVTDGDGREVASHSADDAFWRSDDEAKAWRSPAVARDPQAPVACECGLVVTYGADLPLHRMGDVHRERMGATAA
ncbi:MAG: hypothetical protein U0324_29250 [Polyangiales bacterium]